MLFYLFGSGEAPFRELQTDNREAPSKNEKSGEEEEEEEISLIYTNPRPKQGATYKL